jgi:hypothetical protein
MLECLMAGALQNGFCRFKNATEAAGQATEARALTDLVHLIVEQEARFCKDRQQSMRNVKQKQSRMNQ